MNLPDGNLLSVDLLDESTKARAHDIVGYLERRAYDIFMRPDFSNCFVMVTEKNEREEELEPEVE